MKYLWVVLSVVIVFLLLKKKPVESKIITNTTGAGPSTTKPPETYFPGWDGFTKLSLEEQTRTVSTTFNSLKSIANNFGWNDGGNNPKVSISGSKTGGVQSSGSGAGLPIDSSGVDMFAGASVSPSDYNDYFQWSDFGL